MDQQVAAGQEGRERQITRRAHIFRKFTQGTEVGRSRGQDHVGIHGGQGIDHDCEAGRAGDYRYDSAQRDPDPGPGDRLLQPVRNHDTTVVGDVLHAPPRATIDGVGNLELVDGQSTHARCPWIDSGHQLRCICRETETLSQRCQYVLGHHRPLTVPPARVPGGPGDPVADLQRRQSQCARGQQPGRVITGGGDHVGLERTGCGDRAFGHRGSEDRKGGRDLGRVLDLDGRIGRQLIGSLAPTRESCPPLSIGKDVDHGEAGPGGDVGQLAGGREHDLVAGRAGCPGQGDDRQQQAVGGCGSEQDSHTEESAPVVLCVCAHLDSQPRVLR